MKDEGSTRRGVIVAIDGQTLWGWLVYAKEAGAQKVIDALSAILLADEKHAWRPIIRAGQLDGTLTDLDFHVSAWHGYGGDEWLPRPGEIVEVRLNSDERLIAVWYESSR